jgi:hypothetical protein
MQGDIRPPKLHKLRPLPKPKPIPTHLPSEPDEVIDEAELSEEPVRKRSLPKPHENFGRLWEWWKKLNWKERLGVFGVSLLVVFAVGVIWIAFFHPSNTPSVSLAPRAKPKPKVKAPITAASPLTGLQVDPALASRPVTGIMIENSDFARPQSGLQDAGVVYEAIAEGGITRFLALFQEARPAYVGPVRSLRPYYIDFAAPFQASIVHVGGSPEALSTVRNGNYRDLDQFFNSGAFTRVSARAAPHNVYTNFDKLDALNQSKGYTTSSFTIWPRKPDKKLAAPTAKTIDIAVSGPDYYSHYNYDAATNTYMRSEGGAPHMELVSADDKTGVQIHPKVVIALVMAYSIESDGKHSEYGDTGSGTAYVFQDGGVTQGHWAKADSASQIQFTDANDVPLKLNAGQTWLTLVGDSSKVRYAP